MGLDRSPHLGLDRAMNYPCVVSADDLWELVLAAPDPAARELASARFVDFVLERSPTTDVSCTGLEVRC